MTELLRSTALPEAFIHGFSTRRGGVSGAPFESLNVGLGWGDDPVAVAENRRRIAVAAGTRAILTCRQVHGARIVRVQASSSAEELAQEEADGLCCNSPGTVVGVLSADCVPILLADARTGACAAVHAGWRGTLAGIAASAVRVLCAEFGVRASELRVALGPSIGPCCFEVGAEVEAAFMAAFPEHGELFTRPRHAHTHVDLWRANVLVLRGVGVPESAIDVMGACTMCDRARFYSYRRDGRQTGQHLSFIGLR